MITTSIDGHLKLWKKQDVGIEFVKHYRAHLAPIVGISASADGTLFASVAEDGAAKVFDVVNFGSLHPSFYSVSMTHLWLHLDMINMIKLGFTPLACCWVHRRGQAQGLLAVCVIFYLYIYGSNHVSLSSEQGTGVIRIYDGRGDGNPLQTIDKLHKYPVHIMTVGTLDCIIELSSKNFL